jgi:hypothetical protein
MAPTLSSHPMFSAPSDVAACETLVDAFDDAAARDPQVAPQAFDDSDRNLLSALNRMVSRTGIESSREPNRDGVGSRDRCGWKTQAAKGLTSAAAARHAQAAGRHSGR